MQKLREPGNTGQRRPYAPTRNAKLRSRKTARTGRRENVWAIKKKKAKLCAKRRLLRFPERKEPRPAQLLRGAKRRTGMEEREGGGVGGGVGGWKWPIVHLERAIGARTGV